MKGFTGLGDSHSNLVPDGLSAVVQTMKTLDYKQRRSAAYWTKYFSFCVLASVNCLPINNDVITIHSHVPIKTFVTIMANIVTATKLK
jgi:hypothetical protein